MSKIVFSSIILLSVSFTGCQVVSVKQQNIETLLTHERDSILTHNKLSETSLNTLLLIGQNPDYCIGQPEQCMQQLQKIPEIIDEQYLSTGSELYLAYAQQFKQFNACDVKNLIQSYQNKKQKQTAHDNYNNCVTEQLNALNQSLRYSYAYLFASKRPLEQRIFDNRQVQVRDFYNQAIADLVFIHNQQDEQNQNVTNYKKTFPVGNSEFYLDTKLYPTLPLDQIEKLISTYNLRLSGLQSISRRDGFGSEFAIQIKNKQVKPFDDYLVDPFLKTKNIADHPNIHDARFLPVSIVIEPENTKSVTDILSSKRLNLKVINPNAYENVSISTQSFPLAANFSAPYALWLSNNNLGAAAYLSLLDHEQHLVMPHLYMLEPYNPDKKVVVMIHGLASSPEAWIAMTNDIMGDQVLRDNFQVWQVFYSTNMPIIESRYQIYALLKQAFDGLAREYPKQPPQHAVLVGHSMGGVIARLLVSNENFNPQVLDYLKQKNIREYKKIKNIPIIQARLDMQALSPPIDRAIFISTPFYGTDYADRWFTLAARKIIKLPQSFLTAIFNTVFHDINPEDINDFLSNSGQDLLQNGPSDLSKKSVFTQITQNAKIVPSVKYHLIIGNDTNSTDPALITDGVVPYSSAHIEGAQSEKVLNGGHSIQYSPQAVLELRRILRLHLQSLEKK